jgi:hypothetical protein
MNQGQTLILGLITLYLLENNLKLCSAKLNLPQDFAVPRVAVICISMLEFSPGISSKYFLK